MNVLLCGATGHLGRHILKHLGAFGHHVRALARTPRQASDLQGFAHEIRAGDLLNPGSLSGCCDGIEVVISAAGASVHLNTRGRQSFRDIDYAGHVNLLAEATRAPVRKFVYVSVLTSPELKRTAYVRAKEDFAAQLAGSGLNYQILRPTGFFSAFADLMTMARKGPLPLIGGGSARSNPIDDEEVAIACLDAMASEERELSIGGPDILTRKEICDLVFASLGRPPKYRRVPFPLVKMAGHVMRPFHPRLSELTEFAAVLSRHDAVAPVFGDRRLSDYFQMLARYS